MTTVRIAYAHSSQINAAVTAAPAPDTWKSLFRHRL
jgi:hypothetical protein